MAGAAKRGTSLRGGKRKRDSGGGATRGGKSSSERTGRHNLNTIGGGRPTTRSPVGAGSRVGSRVPDKKNVDKGNTPELMYHEGHRLNGASTTTPPVQRVQKHQDWLPFDRLREGIADGRYWIAELRSAPGICSSGFVTAPDSLVRVHQSMSWVELSSDIDVFIPESKYLNRCHAGDNVVVQLLPMKDWQLCQDISSRDEVLETITKGKGAIKKSFGKSSHQSLQPRAEVIGIMCDEHELKSRKCDTVGFLVQQGYGWDDLNSISTKRYRFEPLDKRYPWFLLDATDVLRTLKVSTPDEVDLQSVFVGQRLAHGANQPLAKGRVISVAGRLDDLDSLANVLRIQHDLGDMMSPHSEEAIKEANEVVAWTKDEWELFLHGRTDYRNPADSVRTVITIDPETARDLDDAIGFYRLTQDEVSERVASRNMDARDVPFLPPVRGDAKDLSHVAEICVHIADVSHFVLPSVTEAIGVDNYPSPAEYQGRGGIDGELQKRTSTLYLPHKVWPMLPTALSNNLCSLHPNSDKLTFAITYYVNLSNGDILTEKEGFPVHFHRSVLNTAARLSYEEAQIIIDVFRGGSLRVLCDAHMGTCGGNSARGKGKCSGGVCRNMNDVQAKYLPVTSENVAAYEEENFYINRNKSGWNDDAIFATLLSLDVVRIALRSLRANQRNHWALDGFDNSKVEDAELFARFLTDAPVWMMEAVNLKAGVSYSDIFTPTEMRIISKSEHSEGYPKWYHEALLWYLNAGREIISAILFSGEKTKLYDCWVNDTDGRWTALIKGGKKLRYSTFNAVVELEHLSQLMRRNRNVQGAGRFEQTSLKFYLKGNEIGGAYLEPHSSSHELVEEMMLAANRLTGVELIKAPFLYPISVWRKHPPPKPEKLADVALILMNHGTNFDLSTARACGETIAACANRGGRNTKLEVALTMQLIMAMQQAVYMNIDHPEENVTPGVGMTGPDTLGKWDEVAYQQIHHWALAFHCYTHFTSPIRRCADIYVHRALSLLVSRRGKVYWKKATVPLIGDTITSNPHRWATGDFLAVGDSRRVCARVSGLRQSPDESTKIEFKNEVPEILKKANELRRTTDKACTDFDMFLVHRWLTMKCRLTAPIVDEFRVTGLVMKVENLRIKVYIPKYAFVASIKIKTLTCSRAIKEEWDTIPEGCKEMLRGFGYNPDGKSWKLDYQWTTTKGDITAVISFPDQTKGEGQISVKSMECLPVFMIPLDTRSREIGCFPILQGEGRKVKDIKDRSTGAKRAARYQRSQ